MTQKSNRVTGIEDIEKIAMLFNGSQMFLDGLAAGVESEAWGERQLDAWGRNSPVRLLATMPAWEGSHKAKGREHDLAYSIGAVVGAFATRANVDVSAIYEQVANANS